MRIIERITWGMTEVAWQHEWLLLLDADNVVTPEFKRDIEEMLRQDDRGIHGYYNPHHHYFRNRRVRGLKPEWLRLVRRSHVKVDDSELVDFRLVVNGTIGRLPGTIIQSNANELNIDFWIDKHQKFGAAHAIEILRSEKVLAWSSHLRPTILGNPDERMIWLKNICTACRSTCARCCCSCTGISSGAASWTAGTASCITRSRRSGSA